MKALIDSPIAAPPLDTHQAVGNYMKVPLAIHKERDETALRWGALKSRTR
jgi:hypothetical protein